MTSEAAEGVSVHLMQMSAQRATPVPAPAGESQARGSRILVLTTRDNDRWLSMQETIPAIEQVWASVAQSGDREVRVFRPPLEPAELDEVIGFSTQLDRIVLIAATPEIVDLVMRLRKRMYEPASLIIYAHGDATTGFLAFGALADELTERDSVIVSCPAEAASARKSFSRMNLNVIPYPLVDQFRIATRDSADRQVATRFAYVGRVSEQKNLHTLLLALWFLKTSCEVGQKYKYTLDIYGGDDTHGSPNMGLHYPSYGTYLRGLTRSLDLDNNVTWHGHQPRSWLFDNVHLTPHVLVSPSLHADENFGSSVLASLVNGHRVIATAWGGHLAFQKWFPQQLALVTVNRSAMGPVVHPMMLAQAMRAAIETWPQAAVPDLASLSQAREEFSQSGAIARTLKVIAQPSGRSIGLRKSPLQHRIDEQRSSFGDTERIYLDYQDPAAHVFFETYGMSEPLAFRDQLDYVLAPWVSCADEKVYIFDPHRGNRVQEFSRDEECVRTVRTAASPLDVYLPESLIRDLVVQGCAFALPASAATAMSPTDNWAADRESVSVVR